MENEKKVLSVIISTVILLSGTFLFPLPEVEALEAYIQTSVSDESETVDSLQICQQPAITTPLDSKFAETEATVSQTSAIEVKVTSVSDSASVTIPEVSASAAVSGRTYYQNITCPVSVGNATASVGQTSVSIPFDIDKFPDTDFLFNKNFTMQIYLQIPDGIELAGITNKDGDEYTLSETDGIYEVSINKATGYVILNVDESAEPGNYQLEFDGSAKHLHIGINFVYESYSCDFTGGNIVVADDKNNITSVSESTVSESVTSITTTDVAANVDELSIETFTVKGDANGDGKITASDAAFIAKKLAEQKTNTLPVYADFTGDSKITAYDAAMIVKYLAEQSLKK
ncbi:MAG: dockerin type I repeat-containing protein [Oscillospiraceae bacterium]|nr:dockerin type I repeat-containing protein [Oscillospiraceae bacterium]